LFAIKNTYLFYSLILLVMSFFSCAQIKATSLTIENDCGITVGFSPPCLKPGDNSTNVDVEANLILQFSSDYLDGSGDLTIYDAADNTPWRVFNGFLAHAHEEVVHDHTNFKLVINPSIELPYGKDFYVQLDTISESGGAGTYSIANTTTWNFSTVAAANLCSEDSVWIKHTIDASIDSYYAKVFDLDEDGDIDIIAGDYTAGAIYWYANDGSGSFTEYTVDSGITQPTIIDLTNFDGTDGLGADSDYDIFTMQGSSNNIRKAVNDGSESFTNSDLASSTYSNSAGSMMAYDIDADSTWNLRHDEDIVVGAGNFLGWLQNTGSGAFNSMASIDTSLTTVQGIYIVDLDQNGTLDIIVADQGANNIYWYSNDGSESFTQNTVSSFSGVVNVQAKDIDLDGDIDIVAVSNSGDKLSWFQNDGSQSFTKYDIDTSIDGPYHLDIFDVDGDDDPDIVSAGSLDDTVVLYINDGSGTFSATTVDSALDGARGVQFADIDGDGSPDIVATSTVDDDLVWYQNTNCNPASGIVGWYNSNWSNRIAITVNGALLPADLTNFPVYFDLNQLSATTFFSNVESDGKDIRVTKADGRTELALEIARIDTGSSAGEIYFKTNLKQGVDTKFYVYYNNSSARKRNGQDTLGFHNVWDSNFKAVYHFEQDPSIAGAKLFDSTINRNYGTPQGSMTSGDLVAGKLGKAYDFDGSNDYVSVPDSASFDDVTGVGQARLISYWINTADTGSTVLDKGSSHFFHSTTFSNINSTASTVGPSNATTTTVTNSTWHYIAQQYDGTTNYMYANTGAAESSQSQTADADDNDSVTIGAGSSTYLAGKIDELRISNSARSANWIQTEYNNISNNSNFFKTIGSVESVSDNSKPKLLKIYPLNKSTHHPLAKILRLTFNETVSAGSGAVKIYKTSDNSLVQSINASSTSISGSTVTITPSPSLTANTSYYVLIDNDAFNDASSNSFAGFANTDSWSFTSESGNTKQNSIILGD
jgi:hypothetical protein